MTDPAGAQKPLRFEDYGKLTHWIARRLHAGQSPGDDRISYEDVFQEVAIQWCKCRDSFDPSKGVKFSTFFVRSALPQRRNVRRALLGANADITDSLDRRVSLTDGGDLGEVELVSSIEDENASSPEAAAIRSEAVRLEFEANPLLERLTRLAVTPTPEILRHLAALQAQHAWGRELGVTLQEGPPTSLTPSMLRRLFGFNWRHRKLVRPLRGLIEELP